MPSGRTTVCDKGDCSSRYRRNRSMVPRFDQVQPLFHDKFSGGRSAQAADLAKHGTTAAGRTTRLSSACPQAGRFRFSGGKGRPMDARLAKKTHSHNNRCHMQSNLLAPPSEDQLVDAGPQRQPGAGGRRRSFPADIAEEVTLTQYRTLVVLASRGPQGLAGLADAVGVTPATATRMCDRLVKKGWSYAPARTRRSSPGSARAFQEGPEAGRTVTIVAAARSRRS